MPRKSTFTAFLALPFALLAAAAPAHAATITVCPGGSCNFTDPVAAVAAAVSGDTIEIAAGTYALTSTINLVGKQLVIRGAVDAAGNPATVLSGGGALQVFNLAVLSPSTSIENLVITNGRGDYGGAINLYGASPVFRNCAFRDNRAQWKGGVMFLNDSSPTLIDCELTANVVRHDGGGTAEAGGAVFVSTGTLTLESCTLSGNTSDHYGGAIYLSSAGIVTLSSTQICGNTAPNGPQIGMNPGGTVTDLGGACVMSSCDDCPTSPACTGDLDGNGFVDGADLGNLLAAWGQCPGCAADMNDDGFVSGIDLGVMLGAWGECQ